MNRAELVTLVQRIMRGDDPEEVLAAVVSQLESAVSDPDVLGYIYYPDVEMTAEQIVDKALAYKPIVLPAPKSS